MKQGKLVYAGDPHVGISAYLGQGMDAEASAVCDLSDYPRSSTPEGARFLRIRFLNQQGKLAPTVHLNDTLTVEVDLEVQKHLREFNMAMAVVHGEGLRVFSEAYSDQHALLDLKQGKYTVRFHVPMRFFKMESYFLGVTVVESGRHCDTADGLLMPEIVDENPNVQMETHRWGVLRVPVNWDVLNSEPTSLV